MVNFLRKKNEQKMFGVKEGHTIFCIENCCVIHHEVLIALLSCKRNDSKTLDAFKQCVHNMVAQGWEKNSEIPDKEKHFRFPLVHWAAVYGKLAVLKWLAEEGFDVAITNKKGETALHRLVACQAHQRAVDPRTGRTNARRYSLANIVQVFAKVLDILTEKCPQMLLRYEYVERNTPLVLCLKLLSYAVEERDHRLTIYYESLFKVLCDRLVFLSAKEKLSEEFVRSGLSVKDCRGNTLWHIAGHSRSSKIVSALSSLMKSVRDLDLSVQNNEGDTPCVIALRNSCAQFASMIQEYKLPKSLVPVVKMEMLSNSNRDECCCEHGTNNSTNEESSFSLQDVFNHSDSPCKESSPVIKDSSVMLPASLMTDEQSFTGLPRIFPAVEKQKVVLTAAEKMINVNPGEANSVICVEPEHEVFDSCESVMEVDSDIDGEQNCRTGPNEDSLGQEGIVVERQIDLCISVSECSDTSVVTPSSQEGIGNVEHQDLMTTNATKVSTDTVNDVQGETHTSYSSNDTHSEFPTSENVSRHIELPSPPDSENNTNSYQVDSISEMHTPPPAGNASFKGTSVTPVLLIKLLSEPDVSERFQSLLKEVITGDTQKVDSTQTTLQKLLASHSSLETEISKGEKSLSDMTTKKALLTERIIKLQQEVDALQEAEAAASRDVAQLKEQQDVVNKKIKECEMTCNRLKRRLSDCAGALNGLTPKHQKRC